MICHCADAFKVAIGEKHARPVSNWFTRAGIEMDCAAWTFSGLMEYRPCRSARQEMSARHFDRRVLESDLSELREALERFTRQTAGLRIAGPSNLRAAFRARMDALGLSCTLDHHLRQFGRISSVELPRNGPCSSLQSDHRASRIAARKQTIAAVREATRQRCRESHILCSLSADSCDKFESMRASLLLMGTRNRIVSTITVARLRWLR